MKTKTNPNTKDSTGECSGLTGPDCALTCDNKQFCSSSSPSPQKTKLEKTQTMLSVISTSFGLLGIAGSVLAFGISSFYTGTLEIKPDREIPGLVVKVYTSEGHESVYHTKHISLMPGSYHLEISSPEGKTIHAESKIAFHRTSTVPVSLPAPEKSSSVVPENLTNTATTNALAEGSASNSSSPEAESSAISANESSGKKKRWWQFWKRNESANASTESKSAVE